MPLGDRMTAQGSLAGQAAFGAKWSLTAAVGRRAVTLVTTLVLARLLTPADFGLIAMAAVFVGFVDLLRDMGTGAGIVQAPAPDDSLLSSVFWLNAAIGVVAAAALIAVAPLAATLLRQPSLAPVLAGLSISVPLAALSVVHTSLLIRHLRFRQLAVIELAGSLAGGVVGVALALSGYGVWSLVWQAVSTALVTSAGTWAASDWRPRLFWRRAAISPILRFSANLTGFNVLNYFVRNADSLLIGRYLGSQSLGIYDLAYRLLLYPLQLISWAIGRVLFPTYARIQADRARLAAAYLRSARAIALVAFPATLGLASIADFAVPAILGPAWSSTVALLVIFGPLAALQAVGTTVGYIYQAVGRTDLMLKWGAVAGIVLLAAFVLGLRWGIIGVAFSYAAASFALSYPLFRIPLRLIGLSVGDLARTIGPALMCSALMVIVVLLLKALLAGLVGGWSAIVVLVAAAIATYALATWHYNRQSILDVSALARGAQ